MSFEYSKHEELPVPRREYVIHRYHNFSIINESYGEQASELYIDQHAYLFPEIFPPHFHFVRETLGQFSIIKAAYPDTFAWLVVADKDTYDESVPASYQLTLNQCFGLVEEAFLTIKNYSKVTFKSVSYIVTNGHRLLEEAFGPLSVYDANLSGEEQLQLHIDMYVETSKKVSSLKKIPKRTRKIYISRRKEDLKYERHLDDFSNYLKYGLDKVPFEERGFIELNLKQQMAIYERGQEPYHHGMGVTFRYIAERMFTQEEHDILESYYSSLGYEIFDGSAFHFNEQIEIFSEASHVVGLAGGGIVNAIFCSSDTEITILCPSNTFHTGGHSAPLDHIYPKLRVIPDRDDCLRDYEAEELNKKFSATELIAKDVLLRFTEQNGLSTPTSHLINKGIS